LNNRPRKRLGFKTPHQVYHGVRRGVALGVSI
jgi:IS30 family transposase